MVAQALDDSSGVERLEFYVDSNVNNSFDFLDDELLGSDSNGSNGFGWAGVANFDQGTHTFFARAQNTTGSWSDPATVSVNVTAQQVIQGNDLFPRTSEWDDPDGDRDGYPEPGEQVELQILLQNVGPNGQNPVELDEVELTLSCSNRNIQILNPRDSYGHMAPQENDRGDRIRLFLGLEGTATATFSARVTYRKAGRQLFQDFQFSQTFLATRDPRIVLDRVEFDDTDVGHDGDGDHIPESGEFGSLLVYLSNSGNSNAQDVRACITKTTPPLTFDGCHDYPDLLLGGAPQTSEHGFRIGENRIPPSFTGPLVGDILVTYAGGEQLLQNQVLLDVRPRAWLSLSKETHNFRVASVGDDLVTALTIRNNSSAAFTVTGLRVLNETAQEVTDTAIQPSNWPWALPPDSSIDLEIRVPTDRPANIYRVARVLSNASAFEPGTSDQVIIEGLVSDAPPAYKVPVVTGLPERPDASGRRIVGLPFSV